MGAQNNTKVRWLIRAPATPSGGAAISRGALRAACAALGMVLSADAAAIVTLTITSADLDALSGSYSKSLADIDGGVPYSQSAWVDFSRNCSAVAGSPPGGCPRSSQPGANQTNLLFSWGTKEDHRSTTPGTGNNSWLRVEFDLSAGETFRLDTISFRTPSPASPELLGPSNGPSGVTNPPSAPAQGAGTMIAYERDDRVWTGIPPSPPFFPGQDPHYVTEQRMDIYATSSGSSTRGDLGVVQNWYVATDQGTADSDATDFYVEDSGTGKEGFERFLIDQTYYFVETGDSAPGNGTDVANRVNQDTSIDLSDGDVLEFQFYETVWTNSNFFGVDESPPPDAYYGTFEVIITPLDVDPSLTVKNDAGNDAGITFDTVRAGDTSAAQSLTARNEGDADTTLAGVTFDPLTGANAGALTASAAPAGVDLDNPGGVSETATRTYGAGPLGKDDTDPVVVDADQRVTSTNGTVSEVTRGITAEVKGPVLGVSQDLSADPGSSAAWLPYGSTINLGSYDVGDPALISELALANLFSQVDGDFTMLTFYSIGVDGGDPAWTFNITNDPTLGDNNLQAQQTHEDLVGNPGPLRIAFSTTDASVRFWTATLTFTTDQNAPYNLGIGQSNDFTFTLRIDNVAFAPVPGALALLGAGLVSLAVARRRRTRHQGTAG